MSPLTLLLISGFLPIGLILLAIFRKLNEEATTIPGSLSPRKTAKQMIQEGGFLMHVLTEDASPSDDGVSLVGYEEYVRDPMIVLYVQNI